MTGNRIAARWIAVLAVAAAAAVFLWMIRDEAPQASPAGLPSSEPAPAETPEAAQETLEEPPATSPTPEEAALAVPAAGPVRDASMPPDPLSGYGDPNLPAKHDLVLAHQALERFWLLLKNPDLLRVGSNAEIVACLTGRNPEGFAFLRPESKWIDGEGQLLDRWGTPLFFHPWSLTRIDIRSAGPDRDLFTEDDVLLESRR